MKGFASRSLAVCAGLFLALALSACSIVGDPAADRQARAAFAALQRGDWRALDPQLSPMIANDPRLHDKMQRVREFVPIEPPTRVQLIKVQANAAWSRAARSRTSSLTYLYSYPQRTLMVNVVFDRSRGAPTNPGIHVLPIDARVAAANRFTAPGKTPAQYGFLALCVLSSLLMLAAAVAALRTPALGRRWPWVVLAFAGVGTIWMNWTSGEVGAKFLAVNLIGFGATRALAPLTPWIVRMSIPLGAVVVLVRVWQVRRRRASGP